jgi:hypothetical protein
MSYCRFSEGNVHMYPSQEGMECNLCLLAPQWLILRAQRDALEHLLEHKEAGHTVPEHAVDRLEEELRLSA